MKAKQLLWFVAVTAYIVVGLATSPAKAQNKIPLYSFCQLAACADGNAPYDGPILGSDGYFYGTTASGGVFNSNGGTVFQMTPGGTLAPIYSFCKEADCADGQNPYAGLVQGSDENFYGTTAWGGLNTAGTVFQLVNSGSGWTLYTLYNFCSHPACSDGGEPASRLVEDANNKGNFYGTTYDGGNPACTGCSGTYGTVFRITIVSGGMPTFTPLWAFCSLPNCADGNNPTGDLVQGSDGNFYGTTGFSGGGNSGGTIFKITTGGSLMTLYDVCAQGDCERWDPDGLVQGSDGNFYGTTEYGGNGYGTVFKMTPSGSLTPLYSFCSQTNCPDGAGPNGLVQGSDGNFYGTTSSGGLNTFIGGGGGTAFQITPGGTLHTLYDFCSQASCADGNNPLGLVQTGDGNFYGATYEGGATGPYPYGTVFELAVIPVAGVSPSSLTFTAQDLGTTSAPQSVTLSNTGQWPLTITNIAPSGDFAETDNCNGSVAAGGNCTINVTFTPTATGTRTGTLTVTDNSNGVPGSQQTVSLTGTGANPGANLSPTSLAFGNQVINTTGSVKKVTLTNTGTTPLTITGVSISGANAGDFAQTNNCPATLNVGAKCTINVTFTPSLLQAESAALDVNDNAANSPQIAALSGTGILPVSLTPASANFGSVPQATSSASKNFTLKNNQFTALTISSIGFTGANAGDFSYGGTCGSTLAAKASCTISVTFTPGLIGAESATLTVTESAPPPYSTMTASLSGTGIAQATVSPSSITYGPQKVGTTSDARNVTLKNNLSTALTISPFSFSGADPSDFAVSTSTCGSSLAAKSSCTISVVFTPIATGTRTATLNVNDSANNSPQPVSLTGTGK